MDSYGMIQIESNSMKQDMGTITSVSDNLQKAISTVPIPSLHTDDTFAIESQTSNVYSVGYIRRTPFRENGDTQEHDPNQLRRSWMWTNALWVTATSSLINRWQARQDGYTLCLNVLRAPSGDEELHQNEEGEQTSKPYMALYPVTRKNVYIHNISYEYGEGDTDTIRGQIVFQVGGKQSLKQDTSSTSNDVQYLLRSADVSKPPSEYRASALPEE